jgi:hypothetical protein
VNFKDVPEGTRYRFEEVLDLLHPDDRTVYHPKTLDTSGVVAKTTPQQNETFVNQVVDKTTPPGNLLISNRVENASKQVLPDEVFEYDYCIGPGEPSEQNQHSFTAQDSPVDFNNYKDKEQGFFGCAAQSS